MANEMIGKARDLAKSGNYQEAIKLLRGMNELLVLINEEEKSLLP